MSKLRFQPKTLEIRGSNPSSQGMLSNLPTKITTKLSGLNKHEAKVIGVKCSISQSFATVPLEQGV